MSMPTDADPTGPIAPREADAAPASGGLPFDPDAVESSCWF